jgi:hypothetical protein
MNYNNVLTKHFSKVNRSVIIIIWVIVAYLITLKITGQFNDYITPVFLIIVTALATVFSYKKILVKITVGILLLSLVISNIIVGYSSSGSSKATSMILVACIASLYLDKRILLITGGGMLAFYTIADRIGPFSVEQ